MKAELINTAPRRIGWTMAIAMALALPAWADSPAKALTQVPPKYPASADDAKGYVELEFTVGTDGKAKDISVADADPPRTFERAAVAAIREWTFQPATRSNAPVESHVKVRVDFAP
jgi:periplasmic protein TonB